MNATYIVFIQPDTDAAASLCWNKARSELRAGVGSSLVAQFYCGAFSIDLCQAKRGQRKEYSGSLNEI